MLLIALTLASASTQADLNVEAERRFARADAAMTQAWRRAQAAMKTMDAVDPAHGGHGPGYGAALLTAQRAWLAYRDAECQAEGMHFAGGSAQGMATVDCRARLTDRRTAELAALTR